MKATKELAVVSIMEIDGAADKVVIVVGFAPGTPRDVQFDLLAQIHAATTALGAAEFVDVLDGKLSPGNLTVQ